MENIYTLGEKYSRINEAYEVTKANLEALYEENGGEVTEETEAMEKEAEELARLREEIVADVLSAPDEYAAIVKNTEAQKKMVEAELKALKEEQAKACAKYESRIKRLASKIEWFKGNIADAMKVAEIQKLGGPKTPNKFTIWIAESQAVEADGAVILAPYEEKIKKFIDSLPAWITVKTDINKSALKANLTDERAEHPDGACLTVNKSLQIR